MPSENRKKSFYFEVSKRNIISIEICVCPDVQSTKRSQQYKWFSDIHLLKLLERLKDICLARVLSANSSNEPGVQDINEIVSGASSYFHMKYTFKKRGMKQFLVMQSPRTNQTKQAGDKFCYSGGGHREFFLFPERLKVFVSLAPLKCINITKDKSENCISGKITKQGTKPTIKEKSKYFSKDKDGALTSSAVKKQANLRSIIQKMKSAEVNKDSATNNIQVENILTLPTCTVNDTSKSDEQEEVSTSEPSGTKELIANDIECTRKRTRREAGYKEDTSTGSDTGADEQYPKDIDSYNSDFITKKSLSRKKRLKQSDKEVINTDPRELQTNEHKNKPVNELKSTIAHNGTVSITDNNYTANAMESRFSSGSTRNVEESSTTLVVLSENECSDHNDVAMKPSQEDERLVTKDKTDNGKQYDSITIDDAAPSFDNVKKIADLENTHINFLVQKLQKRLKSIFMGKEYCRRHNDYKRGGRSKGDLAFQVRFGLYSEEQQEAIMRELVSIFCSRHNKYLDYLTKVLLPETFIRIYIELFGGNHDEAERILMGLEKKKEISQTDGSSTE